MASKMNTENIMTYKAIASYDAEYPINFENHHWCTVDGYVLYHEDWEYERYVFEDSATSIQYIEANRQGEYIIFPSEENTNPLKAKITKIFLIYYKPIDLVLAGKDINLDINDPDFINYINTLPENKINDFKNNVINSSPSLKTLIITAASPEHQQEIESNLFFINFMLLSMLCITVYSAIKFTITDKEAEESDGEQLGGESFTNQIYKLLKNEQKNKLLEQTHDIEDNSSFTVYQKQNNALIKVSLYSEMQKQGQNNENELFKEIFESERGDLFRHMVEKDNVKTIGIELSKSEEDACFAIQILLRNSSYKGNAGEIKITDASSSYNGSTVPYLKFTKSEYLHAFGLKKTLTTRGKMEYRSNESTEAMKALLSLNDKKFLTYYKRSYWDEGKNEKRYNVLKSYSTLITIKGEVFNDLTEKEADKIMLGNEINKGKTIIIELHPILIDRIHDRFISKPANYRQEIKLLKGKHTVYIDRFINYLFVETTLKRPKDNIIKINRRDLSKKLRMDTYIKNYLWKKIDRTLEQCYETAKELGYLLNYKINQKGQSKHFDIFYLNPDKFPSLNDNEESINNIL